MFMCGGYLGACCDCENVVMMSVGCGLPWDFGVFIWYCDYDVCEYVAHPPPSALVSLYSNGYSL